MNQRPKKWRELRAKAVLIEQPEMTIEEVWNNGFIEARRLAAELMVELKQPGLGALIKGIGEKHNLEVDHE